MTCLVSVDALFFSSWADSGAPLASCLSFTHFWQPVLLFLSFLFFPLLLLRSLSLSLSLVMGCVIKQQSLARCIHLMYQRGTYSAIREVTRPLLPTKEEKEREEDQLTCYLFTGFTFTTKSDGADRI